jgi:outer membrane protein
VWLEVDEARLSVHSTRAASTAATQALESARELLGLAEGRYEAGVGDIIELGDAQVAVTSAAAQAVQTEYDLAAARARLMRALGQ